MNRLLIVLPLLITGCQVDVQMLDNAETIIEGTAPVIAPVLDVAYPGMGGIAIAVASIAATALTAWKVAKKKAANE